jgi:hypothetical protein
VSSSRFLRINSSKHAPSASAWCHPPPTANEPREEPLPTAEQMEARTSIPATWFREQARQNAIPHSRFGKYLRFSFSEVYEACERVRLTDVQAGAGKDGNGANKG